MYKVLLVDDERMILDGISQVVDWAAAGTQLAGTARNGIEAYDAIVQDPPHIVISDIRMPGMDGLQLVEKVHREFPQIRFILLSGFSEFEYAKTAMKNGVRHYLLKPCNENKIVEALAELTEELQQSRRRDDFVRSMREGLEKVLPHVKEQFLKEFVTNKTYGSGDWEYYRKLFHIETDTRTIRFIVFRLEGAFEFEHLFAVKNIAGELLEQAVLSSTVGDHVLMAIEGSGDVKALLERLEGIRTTFLQYYRIDLTIALSEPGDIVHSRQLYKQAMACLNHRFYLGEGSVITEADLAEVAPAVDGGEPAFDAEKWTLPIKSGHWEDAEREIDAMFAGLAERRLDIHTAKSYVIQWFMEMIRLCEPAERNANMGRLVPLLELDTLQAIALFFKRMAQEIARRNYEQTRCKQSAILSKVMEIIDAQLGNPELSLQWVAHEMLYMNADYLGKLFKKESGEKFSNYVMKQRVKKATELLGQGGDVKIFELAERLGFGDNPQYFSQVFKKYAGCTPSEYMKSS
ncbi:response regulator [Paenibacillus mucilaginosus]|uniref:Two component transcriptional regulator, AraC family n=1 Tax=Paenibacillus mucilaginosus (strain KNP414) TaxID=1036673 RepID=F8FLP2_PAEMK|nr:response regulator [Paenibacillus mucilaginosus]AEI44169.1 two component transcriptional regulator, AraC family [Paenibacillus mucilaginosus KNP414]MCG7212370.1 response regulator [Paenibacillus mucilaginosus]WDM25586.1 response regulator transcription factor [Paenibacillus mucilaginosus]